MGRVAALIVTGAAVLHAQDTTQGRPRSDTALFRMCRPTNPPQCTPATHVDPRGPVPADGNPYFEFMVDTPAALLLDSPRPVAPPEVRGLAAQVLTQFVVDSTGAVEPTSVKILKASVPALGVAVRDAILRQRFTPAIAGGQRVRQLVQLPFVFLAGDSLGVAVVRR
jgi:hypothetical protein